MYTLASIVTSAASTLVAVSIVLFDLFVVVLAIVRVAHAPRDRFLLGRLSKAARVLGVLFVWFHVGGMAVPAGALASLWYLRKRRRRKAQPDVTGIQFAEGIDVSHWENG